MNRQTARLPGGPDPGPGPRWVLHVDLDQFLAAVEVLVAAFLLVAIPWAWQRGIVPIQLQGPGSGGVVTRNVGSWLALAIGMGTVAAVLLLNALRQLLLAVRGA